MTDFRNELGQKFSVAHVKLFLLFSFFCFQYAPAQVDKDIKVLIVAHNPEKEYTNNYSSAYPTERQATLAKKRGQEYIQFLKPYFKEVALVYSDRYNSEMSDDYDVTIFDDLPRAIDSIDLGMYRNGKSYMRGGKPMMYPRYLPEDFDRAVISIGPITDDLTYAIHSKFMTQCHCIIEGYGFNTKDKHPIFNTPIEVDLTYDKVKTPSNFRKHFTGVNLSDSIDVWWAQTEDAGDKTGYWVGQILVGLGFEDSPDAEFISGSNNVKDMDGMALGRSGNIFHWGFSASPAFMTEQAKKVFINTIQYMAQFNGKTPVVQKYVSGSRLWANEWCYQKTGMILDLDKPFEPTGNKEKDSLYLYYKTNYPYFYIHNQSFNYLVDEDAKKLGIPNSDPALITKAVSLLKDKEKAAMGLRLLHRYTNYQYDTYTEWKNWLDTYKDYLFFTETGGYKFMIDTYNNPHLKLPKQLKKGTLSDKNKTVEKIKASAKSEDQEHRIVGATAQLIQKEGKYCVAINLEIKEDWHIYHDMPDEGLFVLTKVEIGTPIGVEKKGELMHSNPVPYEDLKGTTVFEGNVRFVQNIAIDSDKLNQGVITCTVYYQACNAYVCRPPAELVLNLKLDTEDLKI